LGFHGCLRRDVHNRVSGVSESVLAVSTRDSRGSRGSRHVVLLVLPSRSVLGQIVAHGLNLGRQVVKTSVQHLEASNEVLSLSSLARGRGDTADTSGNAGDALVSAQVLGVRRGEEGQQGNKEGDVLVHGWSMRRLTGGS
jgi:hypothetical protein